MGPFTLVMLKITCFPADELWCWWQCWWNMMLMKWGACSWLDQRTKEEATSQKMGDQPFICSWHWFKRTWSGKESESEHEVEKKVKVNMEWKRNWIFFVDILYSQLVKWPNYQMTVLWELAWLNIRKLIRADQKIAQKRFLRNIKSNIHLDSCAAFDISFVILTSNIFWLQYNFFVILIEMRSLLCNCRKYKVNLIRHRTMVF